MRLVNLELFYNFTMSIMSKEINIGKYPDTWIALNARFKMKQLPFECYQNSISAYNSFNVTASFCKGSSRKMYKINVTKTMDIQMFYDLISIFMVDELNIKKYPEPWVIEESIFTFKALI